MLLRMLLLFIVLVASSAAAAASPIAVKWWDIDAAVKDQNLNYEEQVLAFALQGLVNQRSAGSPTLCSFVCSPGPKSVDICPTVLIAAQRTRGCGSLKLATIMPTMFSRSFSICCSHLQGWVVMVSD